MPGVNVGSGEDVRFPWAPIVPSFGFGTVARTRCEVVISGTHVVLNKNPDVVSWWVGEGIRRRQEDEEFATIDMLDSELPALLTCGVQ